MSYTPQSFSLLPTGVKNLIIINGIFALATYVLQETHIVNLYEFFALYPLGYGLFRPWQLITYMFMHANLEHLIFNMFALWMFGYILENAWGTKRFLSYYLLCGIGAGVCSLLLSSSTVGASGAVYGILLAFGMMFPNERIYLYFLVPIKAKWFVIGYGILELLLGVGATNDGIAHFAHLGGMITGLIIILIWRHNAKKQFKRRNEGF